MACAAHHWKSCFRICSAVEGIWQSDLSHKIKLDHSKYLDTVLHQAKIHLGYQELKLEILIDHSDQSDFSS